MTDWKENEKEKEKDHKFLVHIIGEIAKYAKDNEMSVDDTINSIADWLKAMTEIATFENFKGDWE